MNIPDIKVQLVHLDGPFKGEIQDFFEPIIVIGRHPECQLIFPKECETISRKHAEIIREGNRFKFVDHSSNGTLINGKQQKEVFLKDGDVLIIGGEQGPKVSFLSSKLEPGEGEAIASAGGGKEKQVPDPTPLPVEDVLEVKAVIPKKNTPPPSPIRKPEPVIPKIQPSTPATPPPPEPVPAVAKTFIIQYGATLTSFKKLPITIGSGSDCDCTLQHRALLEEHAQIFFRDNKYWVKDLTGRGLLTVNLQQVQSEAPLQPDTCLALSPDGPKFQFLGEGRLAEIDTPDETPGRPLSGKSKQQRKRASQTNTSRNNKFLIWLLLIVLGLAATAAAWYFLPSSFFADLLDHPVLEIFKKGN